MQLNDYIIRNSLLEKILYYYQHIISSEHSLFFAITTDIRFGPMQIRGDIEKFKKSSIFYFYKTKYLPRIYLQHYQYKLYDEAQQ